MADRTPIIVGAGQCVEREYTESAPMELAARASSHAIAACEGLGVSEAIDTVAVIKIFSDSAKMWETRLGRSNNPPQSVASRIGASPRDRIYSETGGNEPQSLLLEFFADLQAGRRSCVLLCGAEAIKNQRNAERRKLDLNWTEEFDQPLEDRGFGTFVASQQERHNGMIAPIYYYILMEDYRRQKLGLSCDDYLAQSGKLLESFSAVAAQNPNAQFPNAMTSEEILGAEPLTHLYTKRMVAQDSVNQGAALLLTTVGKARELGIPDSNWVYLHGAAQGIDVDTSLRPDPSVSEMSQEVIRATFERAGKSIDDISLIDIYSCFPVAVTAVAEALGLPTDGSRRLTLTGGLPYFGGPGNNYSMHGLAEMWSQIRQQPEQFAFIHANGGVLSKHASGIYSCRPSDVDWSMEEVNITCELSRREEIAHPKGGTVIAYTINYMKGAPVQGILLCETDDRKRFVCCTRAEDQDIVAEMVATESAGRRITVSDDPDNEHTLHFKFLP